ncbi:hypothetical protein RHMOL_Rhmol12G0218300 [Rhododendron molle]|uniref:Uncharacterized protein n=1 Tax=Rhododendron molle TaxID=49168 RepID=A0ACC0LL60_RHOML|nr:hypothetical protein RHMOL_Rhmol12G0218300 [Rhododendron molle]
MLLREKKDGFDIVLGDVLMPDMDGFKLFEDVRLEMDLPIINILIGGSNAMLKLVEAKEMELDWLHKSAVGKLINFCYVNTLQDLFISNDAWDNQKITSSRCVRIACYDVPLNAWCSSTFIDIEKLWDDVIKLDELTEKSIAFDKWRNDNDMKDAVVEIDPGEDESLYFDVYDAHEEGLGMEIDPIALHMEDDGALERG